MSQGQQPHSDSWELDSFQPFQPVETSPLVPNEKRVRVVTIEEENDADDEVSVENRNSGAQELSSRAGSSKSSKKPEGVLEIPMAARRALVALSPELLEKKEKVLRSALEAIRPNDSLARRVMSNEDELKVADEMYLLDRAVEGFRDNESPFSLCPMYRPSRLHHSHLNELLLTRLEKLNQHLATKGKCPLDLPYWGPDGSLDDPWDEQLFTEIAVLFREDVENFLTYCLHPDEAPAKGSPYRPSRREKAQAKRERQPLAELPLDDDKENIPPPRAAHTCTPRPSTAPPLRPALRTPATAANATPLGSRRLYNTPEQLIDTPYDERSDVRTLREDLARERTPLAGQVRHPADELPHEKLGTSRRLFEIFQDPPFIDPHEEDFQQRVSDVNWKGPVNPYPESPERTLVDDYSNATHWGRPLSPVGGNPHRLRKEGGRVGLGANQFQHTFDAGMPPHSSPNAPATDNSRFKLGVPHFDMKLKVELIDEWDGDTDTIVDWFESVNALASRSDIVFVQLGELVPTRLRKKAKSWWLSLSAKRRSEASRNWSTLRRCIARYYMGRQWWDRLKVQAKDCRYRDTNGQGESPSEYFIRKFKLLDTAEDYSDSVMIMSIMDGAPRFWRSIIDTMSLQDVADLQEKIHFHEDSLKSSPLDNSASLRNLESRLKALEGSSRGFKSGPPPAVNHRYPLRSARVHQTIVEVPEEEDFDWSAHAHLAGWSKELPKPPFPRDDSVRSKGKTPEDKGARPCRHCGPPKHWDSDCKHSKKGMRQARVNFASVGEEFWEAQDEYDDLYYEDSSDEGEGDGALNPLN